MVNRFLPFRPNADGFDGFFGKPFPGRVSVGGGFYPGVFLDFLFPKRFIRKVIKPISYNKIILTLITVSNKITWSYLSSTNNTD